MVRGTRARWLPAGRFESAAEDRRKRRFVSVGSQKGSMSTLHVGRQRRQPHSKLRRCTHIDAGPRDEKGRGRGAGAFLALVRSGCGTGARYLAGLTATAKAADFKPAGWMIISLRMWRALRELWRNRRRRTSSVMLCAAKCLCRWVRRKRLIKKMKGTELAAGLGAIAASSATADAPLVMKRGPRGCRRGRLKPVDSAWLFHRTLVGGSKRQGH